MKILRTPFTGGLVLLLLSCSPRGSAQVRLLDDFESLSAWKPVTSHGDASKLMLTSGPGRTGKAMVMEFSFLGHMGSAAAEKKLGLHLPPNYQISFDLRADAPVNNFILCLMDTLDNVWIVIRSNYEFPRTWTKYTIRTFDIYYKNFVAKRADNRNNGFLPYEARAIGVFVMLGQKKRAEETLDFFMNSRRPAAWKGWGEIVWKDRDAPKNIGDMPHA